MGGRVVPDLADIGLLSPSSSSLNASSSLPNVPVALFLLAFFPTDTVDSY